MSFVRQRLPRAEPAPTKGPVRLSPDVHAAIGVAGTIAGVHYVDQGLRVNLGDTYLSGANLSGATLLGANVSGANLTGANLLDAKLTRAILSGADMTDVKLRRGQLTSLQLHNVQKEDRIAWIP